MGMGTKKDGKRAETKMDRCRYNRRARPRAKAKPGSSKKVRRCDEPKAIRKLNLRPDPDPSLRLLLLSKLSEVEISLGLADQADRPLLAELFIPVNVPLGLLDPMPSEIPRPTLNDTSTRSCRIGTIRCTSGRRTRSNIKRVSQH